MPTLEWIGKDKVVNHHLEVPYRVLERQYSYDEAGQHEDDNGSENMIIHGDNLSALKSLLPRYEGRVKCIYIDPPYNTGEEAWAYNDNVNDPHIRRWLGNVVGKEGEDLSRHDKWLCMMYPRLKLLHRLLAEDGVIFISIDDNELYNLKLTCDEILGASNFLACFIWEKRVTRENRKTISNRHDYILAYMKRIELAQQTIQLFPMTEDALQRYRNPDNDPRGPWTSVPGIAQAGHATNSQFYTLVTPTGRILDPPSGSCWRLTQEKMNAAIADNRIWFGSNGNGVPRIKKFLSDGNQGLTPESLWRSDDVGTNDSAKRELVNIFAGRAVFTTPKPSKLLVRILKLCCKQNDIILDSFAGSGTTAHAVLNMNKADGGNRKFILIEMMDYADSITAERVRRVIQGYGSGKQAVPGTGGSFSYYELGEPLMIGENLNEKVGAEKIREYVYFTETKSPMDVPKVEEPYLLGVHIGTAYYFYYDPERVTTLNREFLHTVKTRAEGYVMYADLCTLSAAELERHHITFKKIPRDITKL